MDEKTVTELSAEWLVDTVNFLCGVAGHHHRRLLRLCHWRCRLPAGISKGLRGMVPES